LKLIAEFNKEILNLRSALNWFINYIVTKKRALVITMLIQLKHIAALPFRSQSILESNPNNINIQEAKDENPFTISILVIGKHTKRFCAG
jgi:hypothetical protein